MTAICNSGIGWFFYFDIASKIHGLNLAKQKFRNINKVVYQELNYTRSGGGNDPLRGNEMSRWLHQHDILSRVLDA